MIQIESVAIRNLRGIRELEIVPNRKNFIVSGPNGSGKSGIVDAVQFALTGEMSRLAGKGTGGLTVRGHGPHVNSRNDPASAEVSLRFYIPDLERSAVLTRNVKNAKRFDLDPDEPQIRSLIDELASYPELTLSRREIIKYILVEAGQRSKQIQALLKLEAVGDTRGVLKTTSNRLSTAARNAESLAESAGEALRRYLGLPALEQEELLAVINPHRRTLELPAIAHLSPDTDLSAGVLQGTRHPDFNKSGALRDVKELESVGSGLPDLEAAAVGSILSDLTTLANDPALLRAITRRRLLELGLELADEDRCPLCDSAWQDEESLKSHLRQKLAKATEADALQERLVDQAAHVANQAKRIARLAELVQPYASTHGPPGFDEDLGNWSSDLKAFAATLDSVESITEQRDRLRGGWTKPPGSLEHQLETLRSAIQRRPDHTVEIEAQTLLARAQDRFADYHKARLQAKRANAAREAGRATYNTYCDVADAYLRNLYESVEEDFGAYYRQINAEDESTFEARLKPAEGGLSLEVAFYDKGMHPPGAYHSEGHQDGMGVCLYLALMKQLLEARFRLAVLDDVVMSVDRGHRKEFCRLLKSRFPNTQFIITTHDSVWARQMQTEGLAESKAHVTFHSWSVQTGPIVKQSAGVWEEIERDVTKDDIEVAAARLRRHMEYVARELADELGAKLPFRGDFSYDLGDLLPAVISRHKELLKRASAAAQKWNDEAAKSRIGALKTARTKALATHDGEAWVVNKAIHFNEWAAFTRGEFREVVGAFRGLLAMLSCSSCGSWLSVSPRRGRLRSLRCGCGSVSLNLNLK